MTSDRPSANPDNEDTIVNWLPVWTDEAPTLPEIDPPDDEPATVRAPR